MHEFSIAEALAGQVRRHAPPDRRVRGVEIRVGALRGIEPEALQMGWQAVTAETALEGAALQIDALPWRLDCRTCARSWTSDVPFVTCECGDSAPVPTGTDELDLVSLTVDADEPEEVGAASDG